MNFFYIQWIEFKVKITDYEIIQPTKFMSCFHNKTSIVENGIDALALGL